MEVGSITARIRMIGPFRLLRPPPCANHPATRISCAPQGGIVRAQIMISGLLQAALLTACDRHLSKSEPEKAQLNLEGDAKSASPVPL